MKTWNREGLYYVSRKRVYRGPNKEFIGEYLKNIFA